jgi:hypothetical protein
MPAAVGKTLSLCCFLQPLLKKLSAFAGLIPNIL